MKKINVLAAAFLLLAALPFRLVAGDQASQAHWERLITTVLVIDLRGTAAAQSDSHPGCSADSASSDSSDVRSFSCGRQRRAAASSHSGSISRDFLKDAGQIWSYPVHIRTRDIMPIAGLAALTGFLIGNDEAIHRGFMNYRDAHAWVRAVSPVITRMGTYGAWGTAAVFLGVGLIGGDKKSTETAVLASSAMLQSGILVTFLKGIFGRQRPFWADGVDHWSGPVGFFKRFGSGQSGRYDSFPGGHSITAFSLATVLAMQYRKSVWVPIVAYSVATGVGLSRVTENKHWLSDVLVGGVIGHVIGRLVVRNHRSRYDVPPPTGDAAGFPLSISISF